MKKIELTEASSSLCVVFFFTYKPHTHRWCFEQKNNNKKEYQLKSGAPRCWTNQVIIDYWFLFRWWLASDFFLKNPSIHILIEFSTCQVREWIKLIYIIYNKELPTEA